MSLGRIVVARSQSAIPSVAAELVPLNGYEELSASPHLQQTPTREWRHDGKP
jgi:hypothetical protein